MDNKRDKDGDTGRWTMNELCKGEWEGLDEKEESFSDNNSICYYVYELDSRTPKSCVVNFKFYPLMRRAKIKLFGYKGA